MSIQDKLKARAAKAVERNGDQAEAQEGGGGEKTYKTPPAGKVKARLVGYIEQGPQARTFKGEVKEPANRFKLRFALYGAGDTYKNDDGSPILIDSKPMTVSRNNKAAALKMFIRMCPKRDAQHFMELLNRVFWLTVTHNVVEGREGEKPITYANIDHESVVPALKDVLDDEDNVIGQREIACEDADEKLFQIFEWDVPSKEDFDNLRPSDQKVIRNSPAFKGSALAALVGEGNPATADAPEDEHEDEPEDEAKTPGTVTETVEVTEDDLPPL